jgi:chromosome segregation ATPase
MPTTAWIVLALLVLVALVALVGRRGVARELAGLRRRHGDLAEQERDLAERQALAHDLGGTRSSKQEARRQAAQAHHLAGQVDQELRLAEHALLVGRLGKAREFSRRAARDEALLAEALDGTAKAMRALRDDRRGVARTLGEATSLLTYLRGRVARLPAGLARDLGTSLDGIERDLVEARALLANGDPAHALAHARAIRVALVGVRRALMRRTAARSWLAAVPAEVKRLAAEAERLQRAGFVHLPAVAPDALSERAAAVANALDAGDARALEREAALRAELQRLAEQLGRFEALHERNAGAIATLRDAHAALVERAAALLPPELAAHLARGHRKQLQHARDRVEARLRGFDMALRAAAADNHKDVQRFTEASLRLVTLERDLGDIERELAKAEGRRRLLELEEERLRERLAQLAEEVERLDDTAERLGMRRDPGVAALLGVARETMGEEPFSPDEATRAMDGLSNAAEAYRERVERLEARLLPRPGHVTLFKSRQEAPLQGRDLEH